MSISRAVRCLIVLTFVCGGLVPGALLAQSASASIVVASGLTNPRGITWAGDTMFVAMAGSGGAGQATETAPTTDAVGPWTGGPTAAVARIDAQGCAVGVVTGLPSAVDAIGGVLGADDVAILGDQLYAAVDGGGAVHGNPDQPSGVYRLYADGTAELVADLSAWVRDNPAAAMPGDYDPDAAGYGMVADEAAGLLWVVDPNVSQILGVTPAGDVTRIADLSDEHPVPTKPTLDPEGGIYVGSLTGVPYPTGAAKVMHIAPDGTVTDVWTNLTTVVDVAVGDDGTLFALELSTNNLNEPPFLQPGTGRIVQQTGSDTLEVVTGDLMLPVALDVGPDGAFYVSMPAMGADDGSGVIQRIGDVVPGTPVAPAGECAPLPETLYVPEGGLATPAATDAAGTPAADAEEASPMAAATPEASNVVEISDFTFGPAELDIPAGTIATFVNNDVVAHTASAVDGSFDTGNIAPGQSATVTFDTPGTYTYGCAYHPTMPQATIVVT